MMIDTHAHLSLSDYSLDEIEDIIKKMQNNIIILSGTNPEDNKEVVEMVNRYSNLYGVIGIHPNEILKAKECDYNFIISNLSNPKIVGIGEIGLDYHYECDKELQKKIFIKQLDIAKKHKKTAVIHSRDSINDTYNILNNYKDIKFVIHCYSSSLEMARLFLKFNCMLGIGGVLTFSNSKNLKNVVEEISLENLLLETDCPYLSPVPLRGTKNVPYNIVYVAKKIAEIKNISLGEVLEATTKNAIKQFDLNI